MWWAGGWLVRSPGSRAVLSHHLSLPFRRQHRRTGERTAAELSSRRAAFPIFHQGESGLQVPRSLSLGRFFRLGRLDGIKLPPARIDVSRCKFVLFFTAYRPAALVPADLPTANKGFLPLCSPTFLFSTFLSVLVPASLSLFRSFSFNYRVSRLELVFSAPRTCE